MGEVTMKSHEVQVLLMGGLLITGPAWALSDEEAVKKALQTEANFAATFAEARDKQAVLKLYTADYSGIQDGEAETRATIEKWLSDYEAELANGSSLRFMGSVSNVMIHVTGATAWATYDYVFQVIRKGQIEAQDRGKCTSLLRKESSAWRIFHEHCSKPSPIQ